MVPPRLTIIQGATASGKSRLAMALAEAWGAEIIGADSMQVFADMVVGTAAPTADERRRVQHHLIGCWQADEEVNAARWGAAVDALLADRPEQPFIVCGGTNMWIRLWLQGIVEAPAVDPVLRSRLEAMDDEALRLALLRVDPVSAQRIHRNDRVRTLRALEYVEQTGGTISAARDAHGWGEFRYQALRLALLPDRSWLHQRINARAEQMYAEGLVEEAVAIRERFGDIRPLKVLGYRDALALADGRIDEAQALHQTQRDTRRYARNQETWIRRADSHVIGGRGTLKDRSVEALVDEIMTLLPA